MLWHIFTYYLSSEKGGEKEGKINPTNLTVARFLNITLPVLSSRGQCGAADKQTLSAAWLWQRSWMCSQSNYDYFYTFTFDLFSFEACQGLFASCDLPFIVSYDQEDVFQSEHKPGTRVHLCIYKYIYIYIFYSIRDECSH